MTVPVLIRVGLALWAVSFILFLAGFASPYWIRVDGLGFNFGLWTLCFDSTGCHSYNSGGHVYVGRVCGIYQLSVSIIGMAFLLLFLFKFTRQTWATALYLSFSAGIVGFLGAVIFIAREKSSDISSVVDVGWSGILVIIAAIMQIGVGVCLLVPMKRGQVEFQQV